MMRRNRILLLSGGLVGAGALVAALAVGASLPVGSAGATSAAAGSNGSALPAVYMANGGSASKHGSRGTTGPVTGTVPGDDDAITGTVPGGHRPGWGGPGFGRLGRGGPFGGFGRGGLTVTKISGNTITATGFGNQTVTVQVSSTTAYTEAGSSASLSDVTVGSHIAVRGSFSGTNRTTINATGIVIELPEAAGVVTNVNGSTVTLTSFNGRTQSVTLTGSTRYQKAGQSAAASDVTSGTAIVVEGTSNSDGSLTAVRVTIQLPRLGGQVTGVNGSSITITARNGTTYTVTTTGSTTYANPDGSAAASTAVKSGTFIIAEGTLSSDGTTLAAQRIVVVPAGAGRGFGGRGHGGRHGGFGGFGGFGAMTPNGGTTQNAPSPSATGNGTF